MKKEKIIVRQNGLKVKITTYFSCESFSNEFRYSNYVCVCEKDKRTFRPPMDENEAATKDELNLANLEMWEMIKPKIIE